MRPPRARLVSGWVVGLPAACGLAACQLVDPASTLDRDWRADGGAITDGSPTDAPRVRCYVDAFDDQPIFDDCPAGQTCCYGGAFLGTGTCQGGSACANLAFTCSNQAQCPPPQVCCAQAQLTGAYLVLQGSSCQGACNGNQDLILCDLAHSTACPTGTTCQTNGANNRPLGYDTCKP